MHMYVKLGKNSPFVSGIFGPKIMKEIQWCCLGEIPSPVHSPKNSNSRKYNVIYKYYSYICICVVKLIWVTGKNAEISVWSEKNWTRIISQDEINHVGILKDSPLIIGNSQDGFYPNENRWGDFLLFWMIMRILTIVPRHKVWVCRHFFPWSDLEG